MLWLRVLRGLGPQYYHAGGFFRRDLPWRDKRDHLGSRAYARAIDAINPIAYRKLSQHKVAEKAILTLCRLPTPAFLGRLDAVTGCDRGGLPLRTVEQLEEFLGDGSHLPSCICFKRVEGYGGMGFVAVEPVRTAGGVVLRRLFSEHVMPVGEFCTEVLGYPHGGEWIIEAYLDQHDWYKAVNRTSVNTLRIWALAPPAGKARAVGAIFRMGRTGSLVDNWSSGGVIARVEMATGRLGMVSDGTPAFREWRSHPDSGVPILGATLPFWTEAVALAERAVDAFPGMRFAGLDIAVAPTGPVVIELNPVPDKMNAAWMGLPTGRILSR